MRICALFSKALFIQMKRDEKAVSNWSPNFAQQITSEIIINEGTGHHDSLGTKLS